jgi:hypothetical protein
MGAGGAASAFSIASLGLSAFGKFEEGKGRQAADEMQAERAERAAQFGALQANLTDTSYREELNKTLGNIEVIRAAGHVDLTSPTTASFEQFQEMKSDRARTAALVQIRSQMAEDMASADYLRKAGRFALDMGYLGAGVDVLGAIGKGFRSQPIDDVSGDPTRLGSLY